MIGGDVGLASTLPKVANSPFYGLCCKAASVQQALAMLGLNTVAQLVTGLVLLDVEMPGTSGRAVANEILRLRPDCPVLLVSGYIGDELRASARAIGIHDILHKPHSTEEVKGIMHRLRAGRDAAAR